MSGPKSTNRLTQVWLKKRSKKSEFRARASCKYLAVASGRPGVAGMNAWTSRKNQTRACRICLAKVNTWCAWGLRALYLDRSDATLKPTQICDLKQNIGSVQTGPPWKPSTPHVDLREADVTSPSLIFFTTRVRPRRLDCAHHVAPRHITTGVVLAPTPESIFCVNFFINMKPLWFGNRNHK